MISKRQQLYEYLVASGLSSPNPEIVRDKISTRTLSYVCSLIETSPTFKRGLRRLNLHNASVLLSYFNLLATGNYRNTNNALDDAIGVETKRAMGKYRKLVRYGETTT